MADDKGSAPYRVHDRRSGSCAGKRKARRKRGAAKLKTRARQRADTMAKAGGDHRVHASPAPVVALPPLSGKPAGHRRHPPAACKVRKKPRPLASPPQDCLRGVVIRVRPKGGLPAVLRCMGRRGRKAGGADVRMARPDFLPVVPPARRDDHRDKRGQVSPPAQAQEVAQGGNAACAPSLSGGASSWALPLPRREEPLVEAREKRGPAAPPVPPLAPLARNRAPALWRDGFVAHVEAWLRGTAERLGRLMAAGARAGKVPPSAAPARASGIPAGRIPAPAVARANREISALREENEKLRVQIEALERLRNAAGCDNVQETRGFAKV